MQLIQQAKKKLLFIRDQISFVQALSEQAYQQSLQQHLNNLPPISSEEQAIVTQLQQNGIFITSLEHLGISFTPQLLADSVKVITQLVQISPSHKSQYMIKASTDLLLKYPSFFQWGAAEKTLNVIEHYLGVPVAYHGVYFRRDLANTVKRKTRLWHFDREDRKMLKVIIYLKDVGNESGPFQYIPKSLTPQISSKLKCNYGRVSDQTMESLIPDSDWNSCLGKSGTVIFFDAANIFHRGKIPTASDRFSIFFDYTSRQPKHPYFCKSCCGIDELIQLSQPLNSKAKSSIFWSLKLQEEYYQKTQLFLRDD